MPEAPQKIDTAIILAGGDATRLRPYTADRPKPMVEICHEPIVSHQLNKLRQVGIERVAFAVRYKWEVLKSYIGDGQKWGIQPIFSREDNPLGTGGAIRKAMLELGEDWEEALVLNGDILFNFSLQDFIANHIQEQAYASILGVKPKNRYGVLILDPLTNRLRDFQEKEEMNEWVNGGIYILPRGVISLLPEVGDIEAQVFSKLGQAGETVVYTLSDGRDWVAVDTEKDRLAAEKMLTPKHPPVLVA